jgi:hypothetical protein
MAGTNRLRCGGFIEGPDLAGSIAILRAELAQRGETISDAEIEDRLEVMQAALQQAPEVLYPVGVNAPIDVLLGVVDGRVGVVDL